MSILISASTNPPKLQDLNDYILKLNETNVDFIHCDVMDGRFVKNKTFNAKKVKEIKALSNKKLDVHLMVKNPSFKIKSYALAGADTITIHYEAYKNKNKLIKDLQKIKKLGAFCGLSFNPSTSVLEILPFLYYCDMLLVMSVVPGKSGQEFLVDTYARLNTINEFLKIQNFDVFIEVDGGVNDKVLPKLLELNVKSVVLGNYLFSSKDLKKAVDKIKAL